jgi:hypothetical protein
MTTTITIPVSSVYMLVGHNYFNKFIPLVSQTWKRLNHADWLSYSQDAQSSGIIPATLSNKEQLAAFTSKISSSSFNDGLDLLLQPTLTVDEVVSKKAKLEAFKADERLKTLVNDQINTSYGIHNEEAAIKQTGLNITRCQEQFTLSVCQYENLDLNLNVEYKLIGRVDGITDTGEIVEIKNRIRECTGIIRNYEIPQIMIYMHMAGTDRGYIIEKWKENIKIINVTYIPNYFDTIVKPAIVKYTTFIAEFIKSDIMKKYAINGDEGALYQCYLKTTMRA